MAKEQNGIFEAQLFKAADKLRKNIDAAEYKNVALGMIFLKYISESFQELYDKLAQDEFSDPEDRDEYKAENIFFVPEQARWKNLQAKAKLPTIGQELDDAMESIEKENPELRNVLPKVFGKPNLDKTSLGQLIDLISNTELKATSENSKDLFGRVYEYFLGEFANAEGKKGGQFYTPKSIVKLMVEMIEPYKGRVYDPACGSGGMFVMSEKFVSEHQGNIKDITIYGQESNQTTWKLSKMNLAIRNINSQFVAWNTEGSFLKDAHPDLKADFILANPPFNQSDWGQEILQDDARWKYGVPPAGNANFAWMQHMLYHLATNGVMATVLANGSLSSNTSGEGEIRKNLIENDLVECIVALPDKLFYNTGISACIWFLRREKQTRKGEVLFIDASKLGYMKDSIHRDLTEKEIKKISDIYISWKSDINVDEKGIAKTIDIKKIKENNYILNHSIYIESLLDDYKEIDYLHNIKILNSYLINSTSISTSIDKKILSGLKENYPRLIWDNIDFISTDILENIGRNIFKEWFGKYKPFDKLQNGWRFKKISDIAVLKSGYAFKNHDFIDFNDKKAIKIKDLKGNGKIDFSDISSITSDIADIDRVKYFKLKSGDIVLAMSGNTTGKIGLIPEYKHELFLNQRVGKFFLLDEKYHSFLYFFLMSGNYEEKILNMGYGSAQPNVSPSIIGNIDIVIPDDSTLNRFNDIAKPILEKVILINSSTFFLEKEFNI